MAKIDFVIETYKGYVGFHSTNIRCPVRGVCKGEDCVDCARMLAEEYSTSNITVAANVKEIFKYGIEFRPLLPKDRIYQNKICYACKKAIEEEEMQKRMANMNKLIFCNYER